MAETEIPNIVGLIGVGLILLAYLLIQAGKVSATDIIFPVLNMVGAIMILYSLLFSWNLPSVVIEIAWLLISIFGIIRIIYTLR